MATEGGQRPEDVKQTAARRVPCLDAFEERAAIIEYDGGEDRVTAERLAAEDQGFASAEGLREEVARGEPDRPPFSVDRSSGADQLRRAQSGELII